MTHLRFDYRHQALARATLKHDRAESALRAAGFCWTQACWPAKSWLGAYHEAANAESAGAKLLPVRQATLIALAGPDRASPAASVDATELRRAITTALGSLTPREERTLRLLYFAEQTKHQVAEAFGLNAERVRQIEANALRKLKHPSRARALRQHAGTERRPANRCEPLWAPRGLSAQATLRESNAPTWAKFRLLDVDAANAPIGLGAAIPKLGGRWSKQDYERLCALLTAGGAGAKTLRHARAITPDFLSLLATLPAPLRQQRIAALLNPHQADLLARAAIHIGADHEPEAMRRLAERLGRARDTHHLFRMIVDEVSRQPLLTAPDLAAPWLRPLGVGEMERAAIAFRNCLRDHIPRLLAGEAMYFVAQGLSPAIVQIIRGDLGLWCLGEVAGIANGRIDPALYTRLIEHLRTRRVVVRRPDSNHLNVLLLHAAGMR